LLTPFWRWEIKWGVLMMCRVLLAFLFLAASVYCQDNWNPFQQWANPGNYFPNQQAGGGNANPEARRRATAIEIYGIPGQRNANQKLRTCCRQQKNSDVECRRKYCDFDALSPRLVFSYLGQCASKGWTLGEMWNCASSRVDHSECCARQGVSSFCSVYCNAVGQVPTDFVKYGVCVVEFDKIRYCFREYLDTHPNIKGDT
ncbi:hypothetical protein PFISCL1PPCAC_25345, partial [Pristionchus fissidentatus]